jgi:hypothetical protein
LAAETHQLICVAPPISSSVLAITIMRAHCSCDGGGGAPISAWCSLAGALSRCSLPARAGEWIVRVLQAGVGGLSAKRSRPRLIVHIYYPSPVHAAAVCDFACVASIALRSSPPASPRTNLDGHAGGQWDHRAGEFWFRSLRTHLFSRSHFCNPLHARREMRSSDSRSAVDCPRENVSRLPSATKGRWNFCPKWPLRLVFIAVWIYQLFLLNAVVSGFVPSLILQAAFPLVAV